MQKIILASGSKQRQALLKDMDIPFVAIPADIDEKAIRDTNLKLRAEKIARAKAEAVAKKHAGIIIAGDTFVEFRGKVLEKPENLDEAREMLMMQSGHTTQVYTGFCYLDKAHAINFSTVVVTSCTFRKLSKEEIEKHITTFPVLTWSGAFCPAYPWDASFVKEISGSFTGFTHGLVLNKLVPLLYQSGVV